MPGADASLPETTTAGMRAIKASVICLGDGHPWSGPEGAATTTA
jgi:hypothetical protein